MKKILVVDDERPISDIIKFNLTKEGYEVVTAFDGREALEQFEAEKPDLVILDLMLPELDGLEVAKEIRKTNHTPIIMLSAKDSEFDKVIGLEIGADDYVTKPFHNAVLLSRISANLRRRDMNSGDVYNKGSLSVHFDQYKLYRDGKELKLSSNEWDIIKILIENKGRVVRRDVFFDRLWDMHGNYVEYNTLTVTMSRLKAKLGTFSDEHIPYIETIRNVGYRWIV